MSITRRPSSLVSFAHPQGGTTHYVYGLADQCFSIPPPPSNTFHNRLNAPARSSMRANSFTGPSSSVTPPLPLSAASVENDMSSLNGAQGNKSPFSVLLSPDEEAENSKDTRSRGQQRKRFFRTRLCPYHFKKGSACKGGIHCSYAHSFSELRPSVDLTKTKLCHDFLSGLCNRKAAECPFAHGNAELRPVRSIVESNGSGCLLNLPDNLFGRCATANDMWEISKLPPAPNRAHTFETSCHLAEPLGVMLRSPSDLPSQTSTSQHLHSPSMNLPANDTSSNYTEGFLMSPTGKDCMDHMFLMPSSTVGLTSSKSTDTAVSTQSSGPRLNGSCAQMAVQLASLSEQTSLYKIQRSPNSSSVYSQEFIDKATNLEETATSPINTGSTAFGLTSTETSTFNSSFLRAGDSKQLLQPPPLNQKHTRLDSRSSQDQLTSPIQTDAENPSHTSKHSITPNEPGSMIPPSLSTPILPEGELKLTLTVSQLANIILAAHSADSPADLVNDVLTYIYKS